MFSIISETDLQQNKKKWLDIIEFVYRIIEFNSSKIRSVLFGT